MEHKAENTYKITFKDGSCIESSGSVDSKERPTVKDEFDWVLWHISKEITSQCKNYDDITCIDYSLKFQLKE